MSCHTDHKKMAWSLLPQLEQFAWLQLAIERRASAYCKQSLQSLHCLQTGGMKIKIYKTMNICYMNIKSNSSVRILISSTHISLNYKMQNITTEMYF
jgi:hypothetical protein